MNNAGMRLLIDLDLDKLPNDQRTGAARILRYWAGALPQMDVTQPVEHPLMDSDYEIVGTLQLLEGQSNSSPSH